MMFAAADEVKRNARDSTQIRNLSHSSTQFFAVAVNNVLKIKMKLNAG
jgi:hypothetical protein